MRWGLFILLFLMACAKVSETPSEPTSTPENEFVQVIPATNVSEVSTATPTVAETLVPVESVVEENVTDIVDLTIAQQHKMIPLLENAVKNSSCYDLNWLGIESQNTRWPIEVKKETRFDYLGAKFFKGWISYSLWLSRDRLATETVVVTIDDMKVLCPDAKNFTIDWDRALLRYTNGG